MWKNVYDVYIENNIEKEDEPEKSEKPDKHSSFIDSLKVDMSEKEIQEWVNSLNLK